MLLRHERRTVLEAAAENVLAFDEAVYDLRRERMLTAVHLKSGELKLLVLRQASTNTALGPEQQKENEMRVQFLSVGTSLGRLGCRRQVSNYLAKNKMRGKEKKIMVFGTCVCTHTQRESRFGILHYRALSHCCYFCSRLVFVSLCFVFSFFNQKRS